MSTNNTDNILVYTVKDRCRVCYTCVRECPVKAIKIVNGQAEVMPERCIACGNCVNICSQGAKTFNKQVEEVETLLQSDEYVIAAVAPSFPAEFTEIEDSGVFVGMLRELGFRKVVEVSFGADLVAKKYRSLLDKNRSESYISSDCPAVVSCIKKHHPELVQYLAPIASPMVAISRVLRKKHSSKNIKIVFIGPCIAKKGESNEIDNAITFTELRYMFKAKDIKMDQVKPVIFDPPYAGKGSVFPVSHGLLNTMGRTAEVTDCRVIVTDGKKNFIDAISEFEKGNLKGKHLELLCCEGCIMGPGMSKNGSRLNRRNKISKYALDKLNKLDLAEWYGEMEKYKSIDLSQRFDADDSRMDEPSEEEITKVLRRIGKINPKDHLNCKACGYDTCRQHAIAITLGFAESEMCLPFTIERMHETISNLNISNDNLASARQALKQSEKLANMGQLSAGIAHELNNPLGVIAMYSNILKEEAAKDDPIIEDLDLIVEQADRCKKIVGGLLNFARKNQVKPDETDIIKFCHRSLQSVITPDNISVELISNLDSLIAFIDKDQMMQVLTNLERNAIDAMPDGGKLSILVEDHNNDFTIIVADSGAGIEEENMEKIFTPFFTTKAMGKGTGMGLPLVYGIVKMHKGQINVESNTNVDKGPIGTRFIIRLPKKPSI
jgi:iron only hydrogenase large subunit-like protein/nitrogen-specific signal transduction histidine kinase